MTLGRRVAVVIGLVVLWLPLGYVLFALLLPLLGLALPPRLATPAAVAAAVLVATGIVVGVGRLARAQLRP